MENVEVQVLHTINHRLDDAKGLIDFYHDKSRAEQSQILNSVFSIINTYVEDVAELFTLLENTDQSQEEIQNYMNQANVKYLFDYDDYVEEINLELLSID